MEKIEVAIQRSVKELRLSPQQCKSIYKLKNEVAERLYKNYKSAKDVFSIFSFDRQKSYCLHTKRCLMGVAPTLKELAEAYEIETGKKGAGVAWLMPHIYDLSENVGSRQKLSAEQTEEAAVKIYSDYSYLKLSELMLYFFNFKNGSYGEIYGAIDTTTIVGRLKLFLKERGLKLDIYEREKQAEEREREYKERAKKCISYEDYLRQKNEHTRRQKSTDDR